jgi:hypothetical protein
LIRGRYKLKEILQQSEFIDISIVKLFGQENTDLYILKTFNTPFNTPKLQALLSAIYYCIESITHPVLVKPIGYFFEDLNGTCHPSFLYPFITSKPLPPSERPKPLSQFLATPLSQFLGSPDQLTLENRQKIVLGVLHALLCLHDNNMVHGNLNPDNIILDRALTPHLISSGLSKLVMKLSTEVRGNPDFLAPEVRDGGTSSPDGDVFAFGMLLHALFSDIQLPDSDSTSIRQVYEACVLPEPTDRPTICGVASDVDWLGLMSDRVIAYVESLNGGTDKARSPRREESQAAPIPPDEADQTEPPSPLFSGEPHKDYFRHKKKLEVIFTRHFPYWDETAYERCVLPLADIPHTTIYRWKRKWDANQCWRPWDTKIHGLHHRKFDDDEERCIKKTIMSDYIELGKMFTEQTFRVVAGDAWAARGGDPDKFECSKKFINGFKLRNGFSSRRFHMRRRNRAASEEEIAAWTKAIRDLLIENAGNLDMVVNCDETAWRIIPTGLLTWAPVGADSVSVELEANEKDCVTVLASVTAAGKKLDLFAVAQGKTKQVEVSQLGNDASVIKDHSESGWSTIVTFHHYLAWLAKQYETEIKAGHTLHLILDLFAAHRAEKIKKYAKRLGIKLWFIPAGYTDELQPLDRGVFGAMKAMFRRLFEQALRTCLGNRIGKLEAIQILIGIWNELSLASIRKGWSIYEDFGPDENAPGVSWEL